MWNGKNQWAAFQVTSPSHGAQYVYDGLGRRVEKTVDGVTTLDLRTALGPVADEVTGAVWTDSILVPGAERVALVRGSANGSPGTAATVTWLHTDEVGTTRLLTDANGNNLAQCNAQCNQNSTYPQGSFLTYALSAPNWTTPRPRPNTSSPAKNVIRRAGWTTSRPATTPAR